MSISFASVAHRQIIRKPPTFAGGREAISEDVTQALRHLPYKDIVAIGDPKYWQKPYASQGRPLQRINVPGSEQMLFIQREAPDKLIGWVVKVDDDNAALQTVQIDGAAMKASRHGCEDHSFPGGSQVTFPNGFEFTVPE